ncbi:ABC transporter substrate-binding protein, partial [Burkholderia pseudomultivorans]
MQGWKRCALAWSAGWMLVSSAFAGGEPVRIALIEGMSGPFANAGAAVERNLRFGVEQVNAAGGVKLRDGAHPLELVVLDSKGSPEEALVQL